MDKKEPKYYRILAGHDERSKSKILGDWLRHDFISIYGKYKITNKDSDKISSRFRDMPLGSKIAVYTTGHFFAVGEVESGLRDRETRSPCPDHEYRNWRKVRWIKVGKLSSKELPSLTSKLGPRTARAYIKEISADQYNTILSKLS